MFYINEMCNNYTLYHTTKIWFNLTNGFESEIFYADYINYMNRFFL